ncbi:MAG: DNA polymerase IV [Oscillospiraceae bacterium]|nr:DNA polymerase IV [Oscillospiraceae bacterium]
MDRVILHCDCNSYFASVESIGRPELRAVPMAVCGDPESRHGIILAKNELAKKYGVVTAETVWQAKRKCPGLVLVPSHHRLYAEYCERINALYEQYTDQVEPFSIDESWLDVTGSMHLFGDGRTIADELRRRVREEIGVTISVGVSFNKIYAKLGSDYKKPDATTVITRENCRDILWPLPARDMIFVGRAAAEKLEGCGIRTIGDIVAAGREYLGRLLGRAGDALWVNAAGLDASPVRRRCDEPAPKSVGNSMTFAHDLVGMEEIRAGLLPLCDEVGTRLRRAGLYGSTVTVQIRDPDFRTISRQQTLDAATASTREIYRVAAGLVRREWSPITKPIRLLAVTVSGLGAAAARQTSLFAPEAGAQDAEKLERVMDALRTRYGGAAVSYASLVPPRESEKDGAGKAPPKKKS